MGSCACKVVVAEIRVKIIAIAVWRVIGLIVGTPVSLRDEDFEDGFSQAPLKGLINPEQTATLLCTSGLESRIVRALSVDRRTRDSRT